ncbi:MAG: universal stress protein [Desulfobacteraceae bacterium]|nr:MAG: universal stress protein [Desulfobacteraceae bacterium]
MPSNVLVAMDESESSMKAVDFVAKTFAGGCRVTLLSVLRPVDLLCEMDAAALHGYLASHHPDYCREVDARKESALKFAQSIARELLIDAGFSEENVTILFKTMKTDVAVEIIEEARNGYDVIVLGRRGLSPVKGFFLGSVSQKVLNGAKDVSVLIVN